MENRDAAAGTSPAKVSVTRGSRFSFPDRKEPARGAACPLFTEAPPRPPKPLDDLGVRVRYFVHTCVLMALGICAEALFGKKELQFG